MLTCIVPGCERPITAFTQPACSDDHCFQAMAGGMIFQRGTVDGASETDEQFRERIRAAQRKGG